MTNEMKNKLLKEKVEACPVCKRKTDKNDAEEQFCIDCGTPLINTCTNYNCKAILPADAAHCKYCGDFSVFANIGIVKSKRTEVYQSENLKQIPNYSPITSSDDDDLPF